MSKIEGRQAFWVAVNGMLCALSNCEETLCLADKPIHFALLMPFSGSWNVGHRVAGAAPLAVEKINANKALLPGRWLEYSWADSGCSAQKGLAAMGELLRGASRIDAVVGPACSSACEVTSYLASGQDLPQISWGCAASSLSSKERHRLVGLPSVVSSSTMMHCVVS